jgi:hypothetical protein
MIMVTGVSPATMKTIMRRLRKLEEQIPPANAATGAKELLLARIQALRESMVETGDCPEHHDPAEVVRIEKLLRARLDAIQTRARDEELWHV